MTYKERIHSGVALSAHERIRIQNCFLQCVIYVDTVESMLCKATPTLPTGSKKETYRD